MSLKNPNQENYILADENNIEENGQNDDGETFRVSMIPKSGEDFDDLMSYYGQNNDIEKMVNNFDFERQEFKIGERLRGKNGFRRENYFKYSRY